MNSFNANDVKPNEIIEFSCSKCKAIKRENARRFFEKIPSLLLLPKLMCKCGGEIVVTILESEVSNDQGKD